jgi:hypothetical protein
LWFGIDALIAGSIGLPLIVVIGLFAAILIVMVAYIDYLVLSEPVSENIIQQPRFITKTV